ncbi:MAG: hypothetical protein AABY22_21065 [Nanoarchaeota archaeon]
MKTNTIMMIVTMIFLLIVFVLGYEIGRVNAFNQSVDCMHNYLQNSDLDSWKICMHIAVNSLGLK